MQLDNFAGGQLLRLRGRTNMSMGFVFGKYMLCENLKLSSMRFAIPSEIILTLGISNEGCRLWWRSCSFFQQYLEWWVEWYYCDNHSWRRWVRTVALSGPSMSTVIGETLCPQFLTGEWQHRLQAYTNTSESNLAVGRKVLIGTNTITQSNRPSTG
jgi:hypothetical protein